MITPESSERPDQLAPASPAAAGAAAGAPRQSATRTALAGVVGNILEWFDFGVYGFLASEIGSQFFPNSDPTAQKLKAFAVFAVAFIGRPIGGLVLGRFGDRIGRRSLMMLSIAVMGLATLAVGLLPTYASIGVAAPILLVFLRFVQGFSVGGEFTGSMVYTTELASPVWRGLLSSSTAAGTTLGFLLGSASGGLVHQLLGKEATIAWGWRIPFIASISLCIIGWFLRRGLGETEEGEKAAAMRPPIWSSLVKDWRPIVQTFGIVAMTNAAYYLTFTFALDQRKPEDEAAFFWANTASLVVVLIAKPLGGWLSDRVGRLRLMIALTVIGMPIVYLTLGMMLEGSVYRFMGGQMIIGSVLGMSLGLQGAMLVEIFPLRTRVMSMSFAYSVTLVLSGGIAPLVSTWLRGDHGSWTPIAYYVMGYGVIGLIAMLSMRETNRRPLNV